MQITNTVEGSKLTMAVSGRLDTTTAPELSNKINDSIEGITDLVFDFAGLEYVSSAGLRVILSTMKTMSKKGSMVIRNVNESIMEVFELTGFVDILTIE